MPRKLRIVSGKEVIKILEKYGFGVVRSKGSHTRLSLQTKSGETIHLTIPLHPELKRGTLRGIIAQLEKYVSPQDLESDFYTE